MTPRRAVAEGAGVLAALIGALQNPSPLVVGAALATLNNLLLVRPEPSPQTHTQV